MSPQTPRLREPLFSEQLSHPIVFRSAWIPDEAAYPIHSHSRGEFVYSFSGVLEIRIGGRHYLAPSQYGFWLPPDIEHQGLTRTETCHCSLYVAPELCAAMPDSPCALTVSPLVRAILEQLHAQSAEPEISAEDQRLLQVLLDQLGRAECVGSYLPGSDDALLGPVLRALEANPGDNRSQAELARSVHTTERTLLRRCQRELGMSLAEWRQRLRVVRAMPRLEAGDTVENIAHDSGYSTASAFIAMFRRLTGMTPDGYRRGGA
ncbi:MAG: helix-turn-helix transcriptional regulator [Oceanospirillaceae bacterium]|nr:helix-turn-helix transcriptional regulator [Oceanospirillaceae bacterium]